MAHARRIEKIENLLREVVSGILAHDFQPPAGVLVTVTRVAASEDLCHATVFLTVLGGGEEAEAEVLAGLSRMAGDVQRSLNRKLRMRPVPRITFAINENEKRRERVEKLLSDEATPH